VKLIKQPVIMLTDEEKNTLSAAAEIFKAIEDALRDNREQGYTPFQEGLNAPMSFWNIYYSVRRIDDEELIP
jgi:hypothetical protein